MVKPGKIAIKGLYSEVIKGLSYKEAGDRYFVSATTVRRWFSELGLCTVKKPVVFICSHCGKRASKPYGEFFDGNKRKDYLFCSDKCIKEFERANKTQFSSLI